MTHLTIAQFPGFGGYVPGVLTDITNLPSVARTLGEVDEAAESFGIEPVSPLLAGGETVSFDALAETPARLHLATFATAMGLFSVLEDKNAVKVDLILGHSTGEFAALAAAGCMSTKDVARVLCEREAALAAGDFQGGLTVLRSGRELAEAVCRVVGDWYLMPSLLNAPDQTVVSGRLDALDRLEKVAQAAEIQTTRLLVAYVHHNPLLGPAARMLAARTENYPVTRPQRPIYSPILDGFVRTATDARRIVERNLIDPVRYLPGLRRLYDEFGARRFVEVGPRPILSDLTSLCLPADAVVSAPPYQARTAEQIVSCLADGVPTTPDGQQAASSVAPSALTRDEVLNQLRRAFADDLGYPLEVLTEDAHLDADLGVQSVKKTELLVRALERYTLPSPPAKLRLRNYNSLGTLADLVVRLADDHVEITPDGVVI